MQTCRVITHVYIHNLLTLNRASQHLRRPSTRGVYDAAQTTRTARYCQWPIGDSMVHPQMPPHKCACRPQIKSSSQLHTSVYAHTCTHANARTTSGGAQRQLHEPPVMHTDACHQLIVAPSTTTFLECAERPYLLNWQKSICKLSYAQHTRAYAMLRQNMAASDALRPARSTALKHANMQMQHIVNVVALQPDTWALPTHSSCATTHW
jgi:hypothetical protein